MYCHFRKQVERTKTRIPAVEGIVAYVSHHVRDEAHELSIDAVFILFHGKNYYYLYCVESAEYVERILQTSEQRVYALRLHKAYQLFHAYKLSVAL